MRTIDDQIERVTHQRQEAHAKAELERVETCDRRLARLYADKRAARAVNPPAEIPRKKVRI